MKGGYQMADEVRELRFVIRDGKRILQFWSGPYTVLHPSGRHIKEWRDVPLADESK